MRQGQRQELRLSHRLAMTPRLQQAIKLLQLSHLDLAESVAQEVEENPLLQREWDDPIHSQGTGEAYDWLQQVAQPEPDLRGHLLQQLGQQRLDTSEQALAVELIDALDQDGYLRVDLEDLSAEAGCSVTHLKSLLIKLQRMEPTGVFARDLRECLALQLAERALMDRAMALLLDHLHLVAQRAWGELERICDISSEELQTRLQMLRSLDPRPGFAFSADLPETRVSELLVLPKQGGGWQVELTPGTQPQIRIDQHAYRLLAARCRTSQERAYISECLQAAKWLERALRQRKTTLLRVGEALVNHQEAFFTRGEEALRPLTRRDLGDELGIHESTVSRAIANKYLACPRGTYELRYFFGTAVASSSGESPAARSVRHKIADLVNSESPDAILSDEAIVALLADQGLVLARRTVAKYRKLLDIPSSSRRRHSKGAAA
ncbi:MAG TPA: RNA polymerase factor sigma-54 [Kiloniellales bacterium]|nr:RNA polymerase factor sigma-54 [Kiloniellales bacterium]